MKDIEKCTTYELEHIINAFTWYPNKLLSQVKRQLDKRYRERTLKQQWENLKKEMQNNRK